VKGIGSAVDRLTCEDRSCRMDGTCHKILVVKTLTEQSANINGEVITVGAGNMMELRSRKAIGPGKRRGTDSVWSCLAFAFFSPEIPEQMSGLVPRGAIFDL
jgi:hypothetical protein